MKTKHMPLIVMLIVPGWLIGCQSLPQTDGAGTKRVELTLPSDAVKAPIVDPDELQVSAGESVFIRTPNLGTNGRLFILFTDGTPFLDSSGNEVHWILIRGSGSALHTVRRDRPDCTPQSPCRFKYVVFDPRSSRRAPLDPYFIIR